MSHFLIILFFFCSTVPVAAQASRSEPQQVGADSLRRRLDGIEWKAAQSDPLVALGESAFPAWEAIITDPKSKPLHVSRAIGVVTRVKANRNRFINPVLEQLADEHIGGRLSALYLLKEIGGVGETAPIIALLSDSDRSIRYLAAETLTRIGGKRDLVALTAWLRGVSHQDDPEYRAHVKKCRDELEKRLKDNPIPPIPKDLKN